MWGIGVLLLVAILLLTDPVNGSRRWLPLPFGLSVQVSEFMKVVLLLGSSEVLRRVCNQDAAPAGLPACRPAILRGVPAGCAATRPQHRVEHVADCRHRCLILSRIAKKYWLLGALALVLLLPLLWASLKPYQRDRIAGFLSPDDAPLGIGYQIRQSKIAVGTGGMWGQGFVQGSQTQLRFLPTPHTDFILAAFAEERGFAGIAIVLGLYYVLLLRIVDTARSARDPEGTLLAMGVASVLLFHIMVNGGMVANKLPVTGPCRCL